MHAYYVSNVSNEIKYAYRELNNEEFKNVIAKTTFPFEDKIFENDNELEFEEEEQEEIYFLESKNFDSFFNVTDTELRQVLEIEVTVKVTCLSGSSEQIDDSDQDFDIESILNNALKRNPSNITEIIE